MILFNRVSTYVKAPSFEAVDNTIDLIPGVTTVYNLSLIILKKIADIFSITKISKVLSKKSFYECITKAIPLYGQYEHLKTLIVKFKLFRSGEITSFSTHINPDDVIKGLNKGLISSFEVPNFMSFDLEFLEKAIEKKINIFKFATQMKIFEKTTPIQEAVLVEKMLKKDGLSIRFAPKQIKENPYFQNIAIKSDPRAVFEFNIDQINDESIVLSALDCFNKEELYCFFLLLSCELKKKHARAFLEKNGRILELIDAADQTRELVLVAVCENGLALEFVDPRFAKDEEINRKAFSSNPQAIQLVDKSFPFTQEEVYRLLDQDGSTIHFLPEPFKSDLNCKIRAVNSNPKCFLDLWREKSGSRLEIIFSLIKKEIDKDPFEVLLNCGYQYLISPEILRYLLAKTGPEDKGILMNALSRTIPLHFIHDILRTKPHFAPLFDEHPLINQANHFKDQFDKINLTATALDITHIEDESLITGYHLISCYHEINPELILRQRAFHSKAQARIKKRPWSEVFDKLLVYTSGKSTYQIIQEKYQAFRYNRGLVASHAEGSLQLQAYYTQIKQQLEIISAYIKDNPTDTGILDHLERGFSVCAGGIQAEIEQITDLYFTYPKDATLSYKIAKIINDFCNRATEAAISSRIDIATAHGALQISEGTSDVHYLNYLRYHLRHFLLQDPINDQYKPQSFPIERFTKFFSLFNVDAIIDDIHEKIKSSTALQDDFIQYLKENAHDIIPKDDLEVEVDIDEEDLLGKLSTLHTNRAIYNQVSACIDTYPPDKKARLNIWLTTDGNKETLKKIIQESDPSFNFLITHLNAFKTTKTAFFALKAELNLIKESIDQICDFSRSRVLEMAHEAATDESQIEEKIQEFILKNLEQGTKIINKKTLTEIIKHTGFISVVNLKKYEKAKASGSALRTSIFSAFGNFLY
jgi:hypothetical protein